MSNDAETHLVNKNVVQCADCQEIIKAYTTSWVVKYCTFCGKKIDDSKEYDGHVYLNQRLK